MDTIFQNPEKSRNVTKTHFYGVEKEVNFRPSSYRSKSPFVRSVHFRAKDARSQPIIFNA